MSSRQWLRSAWVVALLTCAGRGFAQDMSGHWKLVIDNPAHEVVTSMSVQLSDEPAKSCMGGSWKRVVVDSVDTRDATFFPARDPLTWHIEDGQLTIGRNQICDSYLLLRGPVDERAMKGRYFRWGKGGSPVLGEFSLTRIR